MIKFKQLITKTINKEKMNTLILEIDWSGMSGPGSSTADREKLFFEELGKYDITPVQESSSVYKLQNCGMADFLIRFRHFFLKQGVREPQWLQFLESINVPSWKDKYKFLALYPMHLAACLGRSADIKLLAEQGFSLDAEMKGDRLLEASPIFLAAMYGFLEVAATLIKLGANYLTRTPAGEYKGYTPLMIAVVEGHYKLVELLIAHNADFQAPLFHGKNEGYTPLCMAIAEGRLEIADLLLKNGANYTAPLSYGPGKGVTVIFTAAAHGHDQFVKLLIRKYGVDFQTPIASGELAGETPFSAAMKEKHMKVIQVLVEHGVNLETPLPIRKEEDDGLTPLCAAIMDTNSEMVKLFLEHGARCNAPINQGPYEGVTPLCLAVLKSDIDIVNLLITHGATVNTAITDGINKGYTPFFVAAAKGNLAIAKLLQEQKADFRSALCEGISQGLTPLAIAAVKGKEEMVAYLLSLLSQNDVIATLTSSLTPPFLYQLAKQACQPDSQAQKNILKALVRICPAAREISYQGKNLFDFYISDPDLRYYLETDLDIFIQRKVIDHLNVLTALMEGTISLKGTFVEVAIGMHEQRERPIKDLSNFIKDKLLMLCSYYEIGKHYNPAYYHAIKTAVNHATVVAEIKRKGGVELANPCQGKDEKEANSMGKIVLPSLQTYVASEEVNKIVNIVTNMCETVTKFYEAIRQSKHIEPPIIIKYFEERVSAAIQQHVTRFLVSKRKETASASTAPETESKQQTKKPRASNGPSFSRS